MPLEHDLARIREDSWLSLYPALNEIASRKRIVPEWLEFASQLVSLLLCECQRCRAVKFVQVDASDDGSTATKIENRGFTR